MTLLEILIALAIGSIVVGSVITIYASTVSSTGTMLRSSKLNQELAAVMSVMVNDIRRAGYWGNMTIDDYKLPHQNPFARTDETALEVHSANVQQGPNGSGECIVYVLDAGDDGSLDNEDIRGFRLQNGVVQMRERGDTAANTRHDSCNDADDVWRDVTDGAVISVTQLTFDLAGSTCLNAAEPDGEEDGGDAMVIDDAVERDCYTVVPPVAGGDVTVETRQVTITITGSLVGDASVVSTLSQDTRVRNDLVRER